MSYIYRHQTEAFAVFTGAAFAMYLGALVHTAVRGYPVPKAVYFACTVAYVTLAPLYAFFWYHSRQHARRAGRHPGLGRPPGTPGSAESAQAARRLLTSFPFGADPSGLPRPPSREHTLPTPPPAAASYQHMPQPGGHALGQPPVARPPATAPSAGSMRPARQFPTGPIARKPVGSAASRAGALPANAARLSRAQERAASQSRSAVAHGTQRDAEQRANAHGPGQAGLE